MNIEDTITIDGKTIKITPDNVCKAWSIYNDHEVLKNICISIRNDDNYETINQIYDTIVGNENQKQTILLTSSLLSMVLLIFRIFICLCIVI